MKDVSDWTTWKTVSDAFDGSVNREPDGLCKGCHKPAWLNENDVTECCGDNIYNFDEDGGRER